MHGICHLFVDALSPAGIIGFLEAFQRDGRYKVLHPQHFLTECFIDEGAIGEGQKHAVGMHFADLKQISLADGGLTAGVDVHIGTQFLALTDDGIDGLQRKIQMVAVFCRPAAGAVEIAGRGRIKQNGPWDVAAILLPVFMLGGAAFEAGIEQEVLEESLPDTGIQFIQPQNQLVPIVLLGDDIADHLPLLLIPPLGRELIHQLHELGQILVGITLNILQRLIDREGLHGFFNGIHFDSAFLLAQRPI